MTTPPLPRRLRIGHLVYDVVQDDAVIAERSVANRAAYAGWSSSAEQTIALASKVTGSTHALGPDYVADTLLHEILHSCLRVTGTDPDADSKAGLEDVEERAVNAIAGPLLAVLRDNPDLVTYLLAGRTAPAT